jgi:hypothetical protein
MADTKKAQLLNGLLREIGHEDTALDAAYLESQIVEAWQAGTSVRLKPVPSNRFKSGVAAAVIVAVALTVVMRLNRHRQQAGEVAATQRQEPVRSVQFQPVGQAQHDSDTRSTIAKSMADKPEIMTSPSARTPIAQSTIDNAFPITQSPIAQSPLEFVPLVPLAGRELAGPFQIMRVQMPRASLGRPRSPFEHPNELIEADILLGEDGMARAIRVSSSESNSPWRSR